jgi:hypothetical protein
MSLLLSFIPIVWLSGDLQTELLHADGHLNYARFWNPDVRVVVDDYHLWCWNGAGLKFTDLDIQRVVNGQYPSFTPLTIEDTRICGN